MKKSILAVVLSIAMLVTCALPAFAEEAKWTWADDGYTVAQWYAPVVDAGTINVDGQLDDAYLNATKIESFEDDEPYFRGGVYEPLAGDADAAKFVAYITVDTTGMYVWAEIIDKTMFETTNTNGNDGDCFQIYFDWTPEEYMHPTPEARAEMEAAGNKWSDSTYKNTYGSGLASMQYLGWLSGDYNGVVGGSAGFAPHDQIGENFEGIKYAATKGENKWTCEYFVPWRDADQKAAIAAGELFHCSIGFQACDDADIDDTCSPGTEENCYIKFDQIKGLGLSYWADYSMLADVVWTGTTPPPPPHNPGTSDSVIAIVAALAVAGAGLAFFSKKREG